MSCKAFMANSKPGGAPARHRAAVCTCGNWWKVCCTSTSGNAPKYFRRLMGKPQHPTLTFTGHQTRSTVRTFDRSTVPQDPPFQQIPGAPDGTLEHSNGRTVERPFS